MGSHLLQEPKSHWGIHLRHLVWTFSSRMPFLFQLRLRKASCVARSVWNMKGRKGCCFFRAKSVKHCFMLDLAMILARAGDEWGVFAEMWVTSIRQDRDICFGRMKGILLENVHRSWWRSHQWLFSSWSKCNSQQRDDGLNWEVCVPAVCNKDIYLYGERTEMVGDCFERSKPSQKGYHQPKLQVKQS